MTLTQVKKIGYDLTGLDITIDEYLNTAFFCSSTKALFININKKQLQNIYDSFSFSYNIKGINRQGILLQALLHEIAHYKQYIKYGYDIYIITYNNNPAYFEKVANRYSTRYYKRFVKKKKGRPLAIDKVKVI